MLAPQPVKFTLPCRAPHGYLLKVKSLQNIVTKYNQFAIWRLGRLGLFLLTATLSNDQAKCPLH